MYKNMITIEEAKHNFRIYRLIRLLHSTGIVSTMQLIGHEEALYSTAPLGLSIDWWNYRIFNGVNWIQF